ncbi:MAG TPA: fructosamine kinase family protein [Longimicrobiales bacterium]
MLPKQLRARIEAVLSAQAGRPVQIADEHGVGGGCISNATRLRTSADAQYFLKWGRFAPGLFACEAHGLAELAAAGAVRVPSVIACPDEVARDDNWLLLEWLEPGRMTARAWQALGRSLAGLHQHQRDSFGWHQDNFIGSLAQGNGFSDDWPVFWRDARILPQLETAVRSGGMAADDARRIETMLGRVDELAAAGNEDGASLLHGDLWAGNVHAVAAGEAALIDPSVYYGHREVDLAMAALFGGFTPDFFQAYEEAWPVQPGATERRMLYQLYYLLVHVNLFGASYRASTLSLVARLGF